MYLVTEKIDLMNFFKYHISKVCDEAKLNVVEKFLQIDYLSNVLARFVEPCKNFTDGGEMVRIIDVLKEEAEREHVSIDSYKTAADKILFYESFYPEAFNRRIPSKKFYEKMAMTFYGIAGHYGMPACALIGKEYSLWNFVLRSAKQRYFF